MKRWLTFVFALALAVALGGAFSRIPEALSEVEAFRVKECGNSITAQVAPRAGDEALV